jgi:hypothetical protein
MLVSVFETNVLSVRLLCRSQVGRAILVRHPPRVELCSEMDDLGNIRLGGVGGWHISPALPLSRLVE